MALKIVSLKSVAGLRFGQQPPRRCVARLGLAGAGPPGVGPALMAGQGPLVARLVVNISYMAPVQPLLKFPIAHGPYGPFGPLFSPMAPFNPLLLGLTEAVTVCKTLGLGPPDPLFPYHPSFIPS